jgi:hypothetical protein
MAPLQSFVATDSFATASVSPRATSRSFIRRFCVVVYNSKRVAIDLQSIHDELMVFLS